MALKPFLYAVLVALACGLGLLLWLAGEYAAGLHGAYIEYHSYVTLIGLLIPLVGYGAYYRWLNRRVDWRYAWRLLPGLVLTMTLALMNVANQWVFTQWINPHFFDAMIMHGLKEGFGSRPQLENYFNLQSYMRQAFYGMLVMGALVTLLAAVRWQRLIRNE